MNEKSSIEWYEIIAGLTLSKSYARKGPRPIDSSHMLREFSDERCGNPRTHWYATGMIQSALNLLPSDKVDEENFERSHYQPAQDGWVFWCPQRKSCCQKFGVVA